MTTTTATQVTQVDDYANLSTNGTSGGGYNNLASFVHSESSTDVDKTAARFRSLTVPQGASVSSAVVTLWMEAAPKGQSSAGAICRVYGINANNAPSLSNWQSSTVYLPATTAQVSAASWFLNSFPGSNTLDVTTIVQEIVNRAGWSSGNNLTLVFDRNNTSTNGGGGVFDPVDLGDASGPTYYPQLTVTYTVGGPAGLSTVTDDFNNDTINTAVWGTYGTATETGGRARLSCDTGYSGWITNPVYTFDSAYLRLYPPAAGGATTECYTMFGVHSDAAADGTDLGFYLDVRTGTLYFVSRVGYFDSGATSASYDATNHAWMRVRESGSNTLWETSPDGSTWTTQRTLATPAWLDTATDVQAYVESHRNNGTNDYAEFDNFNVTPPAGATPNGIAVSKASGSPTVTLNRSAAPTGIGAVVALGPPTVGRNGSTPSGIAVARTLGSPTVALNRSAAPSGMAVATAAGSPTVAVNRSAGPTGIAAAVAVGTPAVVAGVASPAGVAVPVALGAPTVALALSASPSGITVAAATGSPATAYGLTTSPTGIAVPVALGQPSGPGLTITPSGIAVPVALGGPTVALSGSVGPAGVSVAVAAGSPSVALNRSATPAGSNVTTAVGNPTVGQPTRTPAGIAVLVGLGGPTAALTLTTAPAGIAVATGVGPATASRNGAAPSGIAVASITGSPAASSGITVTPTGLAVTVSLGQPESGPPLSPIVIRPNTGTIARPGTDTIIRPNTGMVLRP
ncbi:MAG: hypothetical protein ABW156_05800 [Jiangellaceae bacterium]